MPPQLSPEHGVLDREVPHRLPEVVLADQRFADDVGVRKRGARVREQVREVEGFVGEELKDGGVGRGEEGREGEGVGGG